MKVSGGETSIFRQSWKRLHDRQKTEDMNRSIMGQMVWKEALGRIKVFLGSEDPFLVKSDWSGSYQPTPA